MNISPEQLEAYLDILLDKDVEEFECSEFHVRFAAEEEQPAVAAPGPVRLDALPPEPKEKAPQTMWHHSALWLNGKPPTFEE